LAGKNWFKNRKKIGLRIGKKLAEKLAGKNWFKNRKKEK